MKEEVCVCAGMCKSVPAGFDDYIGVDKGALILAEAGVRMVMAVGDFDSVPHEEISLISRFADELVQLNPVKNDSDMEAASDWALKRYRHMVVYGGLGGRLDHEWSNLSLLTVRGLPIELRDERNSVQVIKDGVYQIRKEGYRYLSFFPLEKGKISISGVKYPLTQREVSPQDLYMLSNEILGETAEVRVEGRFLMIRSKD